MNKNISLLILAGGNSSRFWPLSQKMTMEFMGKTFLEHQLYEYGLVSFKQIAVVIHKDLKERVAGTSAKVIIQKGDGQGAGILSAQEYIDGGPVLVVNADDIVEHDVLNKLLNKINETEHFLVGYKPKRYFPGGYLVLNGNKVAEVVEKPGEGKEPSSYIKLVYDFFPDGSKLIESLKKIRNLDPNKHYEKTLSYMMQTGETFKLLEYDGLWLSAKYPWDMLKLTEYYLSQIDKPKISKSAKVDKSAKIIGPVILEDNVRVLEYSKLVGPLYIGAGTIIGNNTMVRESHIGNNCVIGFGSDIVRSYIGNNCWFHTNYIGDSVVASDVSFGAGTVLANLRLDEGEVISMVKNERITSGRVKFGAVIGEGSRIGVEAQIMPGVKVGKNCIVGPGIILSQDLPDNKRCLINQTYKVTDNDKINTHDRSKFRQKI